MEGSAALPRSTTESVIILRTYSGFENTDSVGTLGNLFGIPGVDDSI